MTPAELNLYAEAYAARMDGRQQLAQANIYSLAALIRAMVWAKHPPGYEQVFRDGARGNEMTDAQMYAMVQGLNARFGGEEVS